MVQNCHVVMFPQSRIPVHHTGTLSRSISLDRNSGVLLAPKVQPDLHRLDVTAHFFWQKPGSYFIARCAEAKLKITTARSRNSRSSGWEHKTTTTGPTPALYVQYTDTLCIYIATASRFYVSNVRAQKVVYLEGEECNQSGGQIYGSIQIWLHKGFINQYTTNLCTSLSPIAHLVWRQSTCCMIVLEP